MKKIIQLAFLSMLISCKVQKKMPEKKNEENTIVYIIQDNVETLLKSELVKYDDNIYFELDSKDSIYSIYIGRTGKYTNTYAIKSNRKLFINNKFYPIIFGFDMLFGSIEDAKTIQEKAVQEKYPLINRMLIINEGYYVKFKRDGEVISSGYGLAKPMNQK